LKLEITDIREVWDQVRPGLEDIKKRFQPEWRPEDVYSRCVSGDWTLFMAAGVDGFLICTKHVDLFSLKIRLYVEAAFYRGQSDPFEVFMPEIIRIAKEIGAIDIEFRSPRTGYERKGWTVVDRKYRWEVVYE